MGDSANNPPAMAGSESEGAAKAVLTPSQEREAASQERKAAAARFAEISAMPRDQQEAHIGELETLAVRCDPVGRDAAMLVVSLRGLTTRQTEVYDRDDEIVVAETPDERAVADSAPRTGDEVAAEMAGRKPRRRGGRKGKHGGEAAAKAEVEPTPEPAPAPAPAEKPTATAKPAEKPAPKPKTPARSPRARKAAEEPAARRPVEQDGRAKSAFVWVAALALRLLVVLLRKRAPFAQIVKSDLGVAVDKAKDGSAAIVVRTDDGRRFEVVIPGPAVEHVANALEFGLDDETGFGTSVVFDGVGDACVTGLPPRSRHGSPRSDERRSARQPDIYNDDGRQAPSAPRASFATETLPASPRPARARSVSDDRPAPSAKPSRNGTADGATSASDDNRPASPRQSRSPRFSDDDVTLVGRATVRFLEGEQGSFEWGIPLTDELLLGEATTVATASFDPQTGFLRSKVDFERLLPLIATAYAGEHPLALLVNDGSMQLAFKDGFPARKDEDGNVRILPLSVKIVYAGMTPQAIAEGRESFRAWQARQEAEAQEATTRQEKETERLLQQQARREAEEAVRKARHDAAIARWQAAFDSVLSGIGQAVGHTDMTLLPTGAGVDFESIKHQSGGVCSVKSEQCTGTKGTRVVTAFGRAWVACEACRSGFDDACNARLESRLGKDDFRQAFKFASPLGPSDFLLDWPDQTQDDLLGNLVMPDRKTREWPKWVPATPEEARVRLAENGPFVVTDPRSWGVDALTGAFAVALPYVLVVQAPSIAKGTEYLAYPVTERSAALLQKAGVAAVGKTVEVSHWGGETEKVTTFLVDRNGCLARRPDAAADRRHVEQLVEDNIHEKFDMSDAEREAKKVERDAKTAARRARRLEVAEQLKVALGWYTSERHFDLQRETTGDSDGDMPKPKRKGRSADERARAEADAQRTAATKGGQGGRKRAAKPAEQPAGEAQSAEQPAEKPAAETEAKPKGKAKAARPRGPKKGDSPNDPEVDARLQKEARKAAAAGGTVLLEGLKGPDARRTTRGRAVAGLNPDPKKK